MRALGSAPRCHRLDGCQSNMGITSQQFAEMQARLAAKKKAPTVAPIPTVAELHKSVRGPDPLTGITYRSKLERDFHLKIRDQYLYCEYEPLRLRLARNAHYTPDFITEDRDGKLIAWEVKGFWREAARVRIKVAARLFPWLTFKAVRRQRKADGGGWDYEDILP